MELRQLEYLVAVVEEGSFTRAAARVRVAQPGISAQIRRLEREFGEELLDRGGRGVRLTEAGAAVLPYARAALAAVAGARQAVDELTGLVRGKVAMGVMSGYGFVHLPGLDLPGLLADFHADHPGVEIGLVEDNSDRLVAGLRAGKLDLAVVGLAEPPPDGVATRVIIESDLVAVVAPDSPLTGEQSLARLCAHPLVCPPVGTGLRAALDNACAAAGVRPRVAFEAGDPAVLISLAARGLGVAILPVAVAQAAEANAAPRPVRTVRIGPPRPRARIELVWRTDGPVSPAARALVRRARITLAGEPLTVGGRT